MLFTLICVFFGLLLQSSAQSGSDEPEPICYPKDIDGWVKGNQNYPSDTGFPQRSLKDECKRSCLELKSTLLGLEKNGNMASRGRCHCGNHTSGEGNNRCTFKCGVNKNITCGGNGHLMSVYTVCPAGKFGVNCSTACPQNCHGNICSVANGMCPECPHGWYNPPFCDFQCNEHCKDDICNSSGHCLACHDGYYGHDCGTHCSGGCKDNKCHVENGTCISCFDGWHGLECNKFCSDECLNRDCDRFNGACIECKNKSYYGDRCDQSCSENCAGRTCQISGDCEDCPPEWHGRWCNNSCSENCKERECEIYQCINGDSSCDAVTGKCYSGCKTGWTGDTCQQEQTEMNLTPIITAVVAAVVVAVVAVPLAVIIDRRKRRNQNSDCPNNVTTKDQQPENAATEDPRPEPAGHLTVDTNQGEYSALEDDAYEMVDESLMNTDRPETESGYYHLPNQTPMYANWESTGPYEAVRAGK